MRLMRTLLLPSSLLLSQKPLKPSRSGFLPQNHLIIKVSKSQNLPLFLISVRFVRGVAVACMWPIRSRIWSFFSRELQRGYINKHIINDQPGTIKRLTHSCVYESIVVNWGIVIFCEKPCEPCKATFIAVIYPKR